MQNEVFKIIEKHKREFPMWIAQFELVEKMIKDLKLDKLGVHPNICRALTSIRENNELPFKKINLNTKEKDKFYYLIVLKKVGRLDLISEKNRFRRGSYMYKIK